MLLVVSFESRAMVMLPCVDVLAQPFRLSRKWKHDKLVISLANLLRSQLRVPHSCCIALGRFWAYTLEQPTLL